MTKPQFIYPSILTGHLDCSMFGANMNSASMNSLVYFFRWMHVHNSAEYSIEAELLAQMLIFVDSMK